MRTRMQFSVVLSEIVAKSGLEQERTNLAALGWSKDMWAGTTVEPASALGPSTPHPQNKSQSKTCFTHSISAICHFICFGSAY